MVVQVQPQPRVAVLEPIILPHAHPLRHALQRLQRISRLARRTRTDPLEAQQGFGHAPALIDLADQVFLRHPDVVEECFAEFVRHIDVGDGTDGDAGRVHRHEQKTDAVLLLRLLVGADQEKNPVGVHGQRGPGLLPVHHPMVSVQHCLRAQRCEVGPGVWLTVALAPNMLSSQNFRQEKLLLLGAAEFDQQGADHGHAHVVEPCAAVAFLFLQENELLAGRNAHAAELPRPVRG